VEEEAVIATGRTTVGRLRVGSPDAAAAAVRAGGVLATAELKPRGLAPSAILCLRALRDPRPGSLRLGHDAVRPPPEWEGAVRAELERAVLRAARPALGAVPASADSVLFADRAELLAALALDAARGLVSAHWWWRELRPRLAARDAVAGAWLEAPEYVPAAIERLAERSEVRAAIRMIPPAAARTIAARVAGCFKLDELKGALVEQPPARAFAPARKQPGALPARMADRRRAPWHEIAPEADAPELAPEQAELVGVALAIRRAPALAASRAFARSVRAFRAHRPLERARAVDAPAVDQPSVATEVAERPSASTAPGRRPSPPARLGLPAAPAAERSRPTRRKARPASSAARRRARPRRRPPAIAPAKPASQTESASQDDAPAEYRSAETTPPLPLPVETGLGGLFHLVTIAVGLGLYGDFTTPLQRGIDLDPWDFATLLGRKLLGDVDEDDHVWTLLAELAGRRPSEKPGKGFEPPRDWRLPRDWVRPFGTRGTWRWSGDEGRLRVEHPAGFLVLDVPPQPVERALYRYTRSPLTRRAALPRESRRPLVRWVTRTARYLDARLQLAGVTTEGLLCRPARVHVSDSHVDVVFALADLPIEVRLAGLDRDPGFVPAAGRYLHFHFE
jgi:hypothetical protein